MYCTKSAYIYNVIVDLLPNLEKVEIRTWN